PFYELHVFLVCCLFSFLLFFLLLSRHPPRPTLFPYTTLFRSISSVPGRQHPGLRQFVISPFMARAPRLIAVDGQVVRLNIGRGRDRKSTRLNSSHVSISYAVFCLKKKKQSHIHICKTQQLKIL